MGYILTPYYSLFFNTSTHGHVHYSPLNNSAYSNAVCCQRRTFFSKAFVFMIFYILVLVFLGGVMVVIIFIVSICSNEQLIFNRSTKGNILLISIPLMGTCALHPQISDHRNNQIMLSLYQNDNSWGFVILIAILIICIISAIGLRKIEGGPLVKRLEKKKKKKKKKKKS